MQSSSQALGRLQPDIDDAAEFLAALWPLWHEKAKQRGGLEEVHPVIYAAFDHLFTQWSSGKPIRLPDFLVPEYGQDARPWLRTVGLNAIRMEVRAARRRRRNERRAALQPNHYSFCGRAAQSAEGVFMRMDAERELGKAIDALPPKLRVVAELVYVGYSRTEIADMIDVNVSTVNRRLRSIRSPRIRQLIEDSIATLGEPIIPIENPMIRSAN
jgi:RNA polymerase sigma factor (sigma-70 family)